jgi:hypothetical protein
MGTEIAVNNAMLLRKSTGEITSDGMMVYMRLAIPSGQDP